jgi:hypothetical protein
MLHSARTVALDAIVAFVSQSKRATLRDSQRDEMGVNQGLEQDDEGKQNSLYAIWRLEDSMVSVQNEFTELKQVLQNSLNKINSNIRRIASQPIVRQARENHERNDASSSLSKCPRDLFVL